MKKNLSKKQLGAVGLAAMMAVQTPAMAAEVTTSPEATVQETAQEQQEETVESQAEEVETVAQTAESQTEEVETTAQAETPLETEDEIEAQTEESVETETEESTEQTEAKLEETSPAEESTETESSESENAADEYVLAENQEVLADGWHLDEEGKYTYVQGGQIVKNCIMQINGAYYGFDENGIMYAGEEFNFHGGYYRARQDGSLYVSAWYQNAYGSWYYYDESGKEIREDGIKEINGKRYFFTSYGMLYTNTVIYREDTEHLADPDGVLVEAKGWHKQDGDWYYVKEDGTLYNTNRDGYFYDDGYMYVLQPAMETNVNFWYTPGKDMACYIDGDGHAHLFEDGFHDGRGYSIFYTVDGKLAENMGWKLINGKWYYINSFIGSNEFSEINGVHYYFTSDGSLAVNGWGCSNLGEWYYAYPSGALAIGDVSIGDTVYHFDEKGKLKTGMIEVEGGYDIYNLDGVYLGTIKDEGWNLVDGTYYYLKDGQLLQYCEYQTENGAWYEFDFDGKMLHGVNNHKRIYSDDGWAYVGWIYQNGNWYYADPLTAKLYTGFQEINGVQYYFGGHNGEMLTGETVVNGKIVRADDNGAVTVTDISTDGWSYYGGDYYYYQGGKPYTGWVGAYYVKDGLMLKNRLFTDEDGEEYALGEDGAYIINSLVNYGNYYAQADGKLIKTGWVTMPDGKTYYFEDKFKVRGITTIDGKEYLFVVNGVYICDADRLSNGWNLIDGNYYYKTSSGLVEGRQIIDGKEYQFDYGKMLLNQISALNLYQDTNDYYYGEDGAKASYTGWKLINGNWYYFDERSQYLKGWAVINGNRYYFLTGYNYNIHMEDDQAGIMCTGYRVIGSKLYYFDQNGVCQGECGPKNGWYNANGTWYYMKNGDVVSGEYCINGVNYAFARDGKMYANEIVSTDIINKICYADADGSIVTTRGWRLTSYGYIFVQQGGALCTGIHTIDGVTYMFGSDGILMY